ncbi:MAG: hypothetical protein Q9182_002652 [Xanthomendoza sp. 2 TL-2023]
MAGQKHYLDDNDKEESSSLSPFMSIFETFRDDLDDHQDRRERIVKASRDITALSKKIVRNLQSPIPPPIAKEVNARYGSIRDLFVSIAPDLKGVNFWRYQRSISSGCQEYVEAVSFQHYLETQQLITHQEAQDRIPGGVELTADDYVLGLFDLTGELMRFGITGMATTGTLPRAVAAAGVTGLEGRDILMDLRAIRTSFESLDISSGPSNWSYLKRDIGKKTGVMRESVEKVEKAVYGLIIRGRERPKGWMPDLSEEQERGREAVESY